MGVDLPKEHPSDTIDDLREKCATIIKAFCQNNNREDGTFVDLAQRLVLEGKEGTNWVPPEKTGSVFLKNYKIQERATSMLGF